MRIVTISRVRRGEVVYKQLVHRVVCVLAWYTTCMKLFAFYIALAVATLWAPVAPQATAVHAAPSADVAPVAGVRVVAAVSASVRVATPTDVVCGAAVRAVGEWLNQTWCTTLPLRVVEADTAALRIAVVEAVPTAQLAVQRTAVELKRPAVKAAVPVAPAVAEGPVAPGWSVPRSDVSAWEEFSTVPAPLWVAAVAERPVHILLRC